MQAPLARKYVERRKVSEATQLRKVSAVAEVLNPKRKM